MTAQIPESLINKNNEVDFGDYDLHSICIGDPEDYKNRKVYPFKQKGDPEKCVVCSACWRGYVSVYELVPSGEMHLVKFEYPFGRTPREPDEADEVLDGDFWLELRTEFFGDKMFVPFENGRIVTDKSKWREISRT
ncbi:hypothetical protein ACFFLZ_22840 [Photobacterium aphoticum]|uniref:hypothetical protein n=1 Tax=Photobacterium aphoticum TaxID=754436 RepID=UPI00069E4FFF|nr:hypothetical protein [Photobacterium aphoticum]PSU58171.1 hypothetical protein C9I90_07785 [Photobacterium aphoticum]GHA36507.1 hypothetical protein GCM10007086_07170 [Photobacterium aphoticum]